MNAFHWTVFFPKYLRILNSFVFFYKKIDRFFRQKNIKKIDFFLFVFYSNFDRKMDFIKVSKFFRSQKSLETHENDDFDPKIINFGQIFKKNLLSEGYLR